MLANQKLLVETMQACHHNSDSILQLVSKVCAKMSLADVASECEQVREVLKDTNSMFATLHDASTADLSQVLADVKKYASEVVVQESREMQSSVSQKSDALVQDVNERFKKLEARVLSELGGEEKGSQASKSDSQLLKKMTNRMSDFEAQVSTQIQQLTQDVEKKVSFLGSQRAGTGADASSPPGLESLSHDLDAVKYDMGELKDMLNASKTDTSQVKRIVLACERDMEDFTAAMDAVNVDLDEMRARVDSTHSIITSRQRVEATVTAEISTMRLDMGDMQEALKAHDAWMEDVSQSLQEVHERCQQLSEDIGEHAQSTQAKLDAKTDITAWNDMNDDIDASIKTVRDMASALRLEVDSRRRKVDEDLGSLRENLKSLAEKVDTNAANIQRYVDDSNSVVSQRLDERHQHCKDLETTLGRHGDTHQQIHAKIDAHREEIDNRTAQLEAHLQKQDEDLHKEVNDRIDGVERHHSNISKETSKRLNALDLRIAGLQGASGESKRDIGKLRDEVNNLTVKSAAHDVDIGKNSDDLRKLERQRIEDNQRHKQDVDGIYEELDQKVYEKNFQSLEENVTKLTRGTVKLCQVVGVFPGARMNDGTEATVQVFGTWPDCAHPRCKEELDVDVELLNWEDCAQNLVSRVSCLYMNRSEAGTAESLETLEGASKVDKTWRQISSQKYRSILDLLGKKADHSVLRLLQISQQHIESQLDRVRHERELWKEVVDKRAQQPLQLALTLKDPHTGQPLPGPPGYGLPGLDGNPMAGPLSGRGLPGGMTSDPMQLGPSGQGMGPDQPKASPLAKRIARPQPGPPAPKVQGFLRP
ncbi:Scn11a [Symbiodinium necroappetens]|uniref:Scn11a protein n=1 Tax=Symbiodinium necroappetens TaxID=1628268 RepID=A0A813CK81_9DINO|nr:Scn11a [Symbiodinium necroappetens]